MEIGLADRVVLVTGGSRGIGAATARAFAGEGARVLLTYRADAGTAEKLVAELGGPDRARAIRHDLAEPDAADRLYRDAESVWGRVDVLVGNAADRARRRPPGGHVEDVPAHDWQGQVTANLAGTLRLAQLAVAGMRRQRWGRLVLMSSHVARDGHRGQEFYGATKAALLGFARSLAWDVGPDGVMVNVLAPGLTLTDSVLRDLPEQVRDRERSATPTGRLSDPCDVAAAAVFLCSAANRNITGELVTVAGGR